MNGNSISGIQGEVWESSIAELAESLKRDYGLCRAMYILKNVYGLPAPTIARLYGKYPNFVHVCVNHVTKRGGVAIREVLESYGRAPEDAGRVCAERGELSAECLGLWTEVFLYEVGRRAYENMLLVWGAAERILAAHKVVYPAFYDLVRGLYGDPKLYKVAGVAYSRGRWRVGAGAAAYTYVMWLYALEREGLLAFDQAERVRRALKELSGADPLDGSNARITQLLSIMAVNWVGEKGEEVERVLRERLKRLADRAKRL